MGGKVVPLCCVLVLALHASATSSARPAEVESQPQVRNRCMAVTYPEGSTVDLVLKGTTRQPGASGKAKVKRMRGVTQIEVKAEGLWPAIEFGGDFNTYVLWTISPEGITMNSGELVLRGTKSDLETSTPLMSFGILVTAEPHFLVGRPSKFAVLETSADSLTRQKGITTTVAEYDTAEQKYEYRRENLTGIPDTSGTLRTERFQAIIALRLAREAAAGRWAPELYKAAEAALDETQRAFQNKVEEERYAPIARRAIGMAVEARRVAQEHAAQHALESERRQSKETEERLAQAKASAEEAATRAREQARLAREAEEKARLAMEQAERKMLEANQEAERIAREKLAAEQRAVTAQRQTVAMYARLETALSRVAETRETERGLMVNLPDILFDSGKATLRPKAREVLSRIAGILLVVPEYHISVEGHTDSVGRAKANQRLSEERALNVGDYLAEAQIPPTLMTVRGFGKSKPVASNDTPAGRQKNRRVEIIIEGLTKAGSGLLPPTP